MATNEQDEELDWILEQVYGRTLHLKKPKAKAALLAWRDRHTKEAVERPTDLLRSALAIAKREEAEGCGKTNWPAFRKQLETYFAELSAPQQSTSPDGSAE